jgi:hypothetical protein
MEYINRIARGRRFCGTWAMLQMDWRREGQVTDHQARRERGVSPAAAKKGRPHIILLRGRRLGLRGLW